MSQLPTFLLIGAAKSGTTSLYQYLGQHPEIFMSPLKEPNFFAFKGHDVSFCGPGDGRCNRLSVTSLCKYQKLFEPAGTSIRGEASPSSLYYPQAPERIAHHIPTAKLVAIIRDPVERAYSNFLMMVEMGREPHRDFAAALKQEFRRLEEGWSYFWGYTELGFYYEQLRRFYDCFDPEQIHVCLFEDFVEAPVSISQHLYQFLGADATFAPTPLQYNSGGLPRHSFLNRMMHDGHPLRVLARTLLPASFRTRIASAIKRWNCYRPPMSRALRTDLRALYHNDIRQLQNLIDRDLSHWLKTDPSHP